MRLWGDHPFPGRCSGMDAYEELSDVFPNAVQVIRDIKNGKAPSGKFFLDISFKMVLNW